VNCEKLHVIFLSILNRKKVCFKLRRGGLAVISSIALKGDDLFGHVIILEVFDKCIDFLQEIALLGLFPSKVL